MTPILKNQKLILQFRHEKPSFFSNLLLFYLLKSSYLRCIRFISSWRRLLRVPGPGPKIGQTSQLPKQKLHTFNVYSFYLKFVALKNNLIYACTRKKTCILSPIIITVISQNSCTTKFNSQTMLRKARINPHFSKF